MYMLRVFILNTHKTSISALISPGIYFLIWLFLLRVYLLITTKSHPNFPSCYVLTSSTALIIKLKSTTYSLITFSAYWVNVQWPYLEGLAGKCNTLLTILSSLSITNIHTNMNHYCDYVNYNHQVLILHIPGILKYMGAHAGETGLRKYQMARMVHQKFKDK